MVQLKAYARYVGGLGPAKRDVELARLTYAAGISSWKDESLRSVDLLSAWNKPADIDD